MFTVTRKREQKCSPTGKAIWKERTGSRVLLTPLDSITPPCYISFALIFNDPIAFHRLCQGVSETLDHYYLLSGELQQNLSNGRWEVFFPQQPRSMAVIEATFDARMSDICRVECQEKEVTIVSPNSLPSELLPGPYDPRPAGEDGAVSGPLAAIQLSFLKERGCILTISVHHVISDAWGVSLLLKDIARSMKQCQRKPPTLCHDLHPHFSGPKSSTPGAPSKPEEFQLPPKFTNDQESPLQLENAVFLFTPQVLQRLRETCRKQNPSLHLSDNDIVCGLLWRATARARSQCGLTETAGRLSFVVDARWRFPSLPPRIFSNMSLFATTSFKTPTELSSCETIITCAQEVRQALESQVSDPMKLQTTAAWINSVADTRSVLNPFMTLVGPPHTNLAVSNWSRLPFYDTAFPVIPNEKDSSGQSQQNQTPVCCTVTRCPAFLDGMACMLPSSPQGEITVHLTLRQQALKNLLGDGEWNEFAKLLQ